MEVLCNLNLCSLVMVLVVLDSLLKWFTKHFSSLMHTYTTILAVKTLTAYLLCSLTGWKSFHNKSIQYLLIFILLIACVIHFIYNHCSFCKNDANSNEAEVVHLIHLFFLSKKSLYHCTFWPPVFLAFGSWWLEEHLCCLYFCCWSFWYTVDYSCNLKFDSDFSSNDYFLTPTTAVLKSR